LVDGFNICPGSSANATISRLDTTFNIQSAAPHLHELILSFRKQVEDALYFFASIDPSIDRENIAHLNIAAVEIFMLNANAF
jgi:hypothetical protein